MQVSLFLMMMGTFSFANALSNIFLGVFLWKLDKTFSLLAMYSLAFAIVVIISFPLCAWLARVSSPIATLRYGVISYIITYAITLYFQEDIANHVLLLGFWMGWAASLFAVGMHIATFDMSTNEKRDHFLYLLGFVNTLSAMAAPLLAGILIEMFNGMSGYYIVFVVSCTIFILSIFLSFRFKGKPIERGSHFIDVWRTPSKEWKGMFWVVFGEGIVHGTYFNFLMVMMTYEVAGGELMLGVFKTLTGLIALLASLWLAKISNPSRRLVIYVIGSVMLAAVSGFLSLHQAMFTLVIYSLLQPIANNMISTSLNAWVYASIESDPDYHVRKLDYIIVREIPLGAGRILGVLFFLMMREWLPEDLLLMYSFSAFPLVFVFLIPLLRRIWKSDTIRIGPSATVMQKTNHVDQ